LKRTKVSMGSKEIPKFLWKNILEKQLQVTLEYFNKTK
ncbi:MAG: type II toxin-antitoxin system HicA family toxin, partial [Candidatus Humimicrobiaceae bacterium]